MFPLLAGGCFPCKLQRYSWFATKISRLLITCLRKMIVVLFLSTVQGGINMRNMVSRIVIIVFPLYTLLEIGPAYIAEIVNHTSVEGIIWLLDMFGPN